MDNREQVTELQEDVARLKEDVAELGDAGRVAEAVEVTRPIIIDLGRQRGKQINRLKRGQGRLWDEVLDVCEEVSLQLGAEAQDKVLVPIVMVYRKKRKQQAVNPLFPLAR